MTLDQLPMFVPLWVALSLPLGPNAVNCIAAAAANGFRRALWTTVGICLAGICHALIATFGVAVLLLAWGGALQVLKWLGAAYLAWLGVALWRKQTASFDLSAPSPSAAVALARSGFLVSMSNPKAVLSYMAVFPQFVLPTEPAGPQLLILIPIATIIVAAVYAGYTAIGSALRRLLTSARRRRIFDRAAGTLYLCFAAALAVADPRRP